MDYISFQQLLQSWGEPRFRADQIWHGIYHQFLQKPSEFSNLPFNLRHQLEDLLIFSTLIPITDSVSRDQRTTKILFQLFDRKEIETVLMIYDKRNTLCISTQSGCGMGCLFCATGQMGLKRNLTSGEIVEQVIFFARKLNAEAQKVTNIVFMGMGEPFHNYDASLQAIDRLGDSEGLNFGERRITISTVGIIPAIQRFTQERRQVNLAISLHAADDQLRSTLIPINRKYPIPELISACLDYVKTTHRRISFEWALIRDVNDSEEQAQKLATLLRGFIIGGNALCHVNLIPLNPTRKYPGHAPTYDHSRHFGQILQNRGIPYTVRMRRGIDIQAGCGQLATEHKLITEE